MSAEIIPYYVEINLMTLLILVIIFVNIKQKITYFMNEVFFRQAIINTMIAIIADAVATGLEGVVYPGAVAVNYTLDIIYFIVSLSIPFLFFAYIRSIVKPNAKITDIKAQIVSLPFYIFSFMTVMSVKTGWVFTINEQNIYSRGPYRFLHGVIAATILAMSFFYSLYYVKKGKVAKELVSLMLVVPFFPLAGVIARNLTQGSNLIWSTIAIGLLIVFINNQNSLISIDSLTGLNNRGRAKDFLTIKLDGLENDQELFYTIIDLNYFKQINDTFGHAEGDKALKQVAKALIDSVQVNRDFIARYGGDEFVMISVRPKAGNVDFEISKLEKGLEEINNSKVNPYRLSCSYGTASTTKENMLTTEQLLIDADKNMYAMKEKFHERETSILL